ncbi:hypothetical protein RFI_19936 [Reticulomyxa filosa]|uniref:ACB domain-containing protein n=1 Tax=Reticulomyxa filosa TaxID=46433 RepID=X6MUT5_RETFI|nr:hypothetical protein RFI_19936 [Reticulomyxa filosa]|eukprot:ETO17386.1 hypothetical protein RFI_19936 [Reticulomyxa filosa]
MSSKDAKVRYIGLVNTLLGGKPDTDGNVQEDDASEVVESTEGVGKGAVMSRLTSNQDQQSLFVFFVIAFVQSIVNCFTLLKKKKIDDIYEAFDLSRDVSVEEVRKYIIDNKVDINSKNEFGTTYLSVVCDYGRTDIAKMLIEESLSYVRSKYPFVNNSNKQNNGIIVFIDNATFSNQTAYNHCRHLKKKSCFKKEWPSKEKKGDHVGTSDQESKRRWAKKSRATFLIIITHLQDLER